MNKISRAVIALAIGATSLAAAPSAFAATHDGTCVSGELCVFKDANYGGGFDDMALNDATWTNNHFPDGTVVNDHASSGGQQDYAIIYYVDANYGGNYFILAANQFDTYWGTGQPNANSSTYNFNDKISSTARYIP